MLDGWYCRSLANEQAAAEEQERALEENKLKKQYKHLKGKLKHLLYENECFQSALRSSQKRLLSVTKDRTFLLDRLVLYEKPENSTTESEETESSDEEVVKVEIAKKKKIEHNSSQNHSQQSSGKSIQQAAKRKRPMASKNAKPQLNHSTLQTINAMSSNSVILSDGHMTPEEVERHLQSRQSFLEFERAPLTVPTEMFSNEPSLDSESNDIGELETSPSNMGEELSIDMIPE